MCNSCWPNFPKGQSSRECPEVKARIVRNEPPLGPHALSQGSLVLPGLRSLLYTRDTSINLGGNVITTEEHVHRAGNEQKPYFRISVAESIITSSIINLTSEQAFRWHLIKHKKRKGAITVVVCSVREQSLED